MSLKNSALLIGLNISQWVGRKQDRRASSTVESAHGTAQQIGNFSKRLLPKAAELEMIQAHASSLRKFFYENTLPWAHDGMRIISAQNFVAFTSEFRQKQAVFNRAVEDFLAEYPRLREQARIKLGDLFNEEEYPETHRLKRKFSCEISISPIPDVSDFRVELSDAEKTLFLESQKQVESEALADCYSRLFSVVKTAAERLNDPEAIFRDSLIGNISELIQLLPRINPIDDPQLEALRLQVDSVISKVSAESIRASELTRQDTAKALKDISDKMGAFMGASHDAE
jgi:hypothetical protein